jgi:putative flippase GtrA
MKINILKTTFFKFLVVGGTGAVINMLVYAFFINIGVHYLLASLISFFVAVTSNYYFNSAWTFKNRAGHKSKFKKYYEFLGISSLNLLTNLIVLYIVLWFLNANKQIGEFAIEIMNPLVKGDIVFYNKMIAQMAGIGFATVLNYLGNKFITFRDEDIQTCTKS